MIGGHDIFLKVTRFYIIFKVGCYSCRCRLPAHCRNIYGIAVHESKHMIGTAAQGLISLLAVVQEGDQKEK